MGIAMEMKASEQSNILIAKPLAIYSGSIGGVTVAVPTAQTPIAPYAAVAPVQPPFIPPVQSKDEDISIIIV